MRGGAAGVTIPRVPPVLTRFAMTGRPELKLPFHSAKLVIEDFAEFRPELQPHPFSQFRVLQQSHLPIVGARTVEEAASGTGQLTERLWAEATSSDVS
jgi:hypothetical protein